MIPLTLQELLDAKEGENYQFKEYKNHLDFEELVKYWSDRAMPRILSDDEIVKLVVEVKPLPTNWRQKAHPKIAPKHGHNRAELSISGVAGTRFIVKTRQSQGDSSDFSVILLFVDTDNTEYRLRRYNGLHRARHTNKLEYKQGLADARFGSCPHIHEATERYQLAGESIDGFARPTDAYRTLSDAIEAFVRDNGFVAPSGEDGGLFKSLEGQP